MVWEAGDPVTTSSQAVVTVPLLMPNDHVQVVSSVSQTLFAFSIVHSGTAAIIDFTLPEAGAARTAEERRVETSTVKERIFTRQT